MRIALLTQFPQNVSSSRLIEAIDAAGHALHIVDYMRCSLVMSSDGPRVLHEGRVLPSFDAIVPRIGATATYHGTAVVRQFELQGAYSPAPSEAIRRSRDKLHALQLMAGHGLPIPTTALGPIGEGIGPLIDAVGSTPLVLKILEGTQGIGVVLCEKRNAAQSTMEAFRALGTNVLVQSFVEGTGGSDLRCFVVGKRVIGAMERRAAPGDFRANLHRGGSGRAAKLSAEERSLAVRAARVMGLEVAGVDLVRSPDGPMVLEVNSSPGLQGIEAVTRTDVAGQVIAHVVRKVEAQGD